MLLAQPALRGELIGDVAKRGLHGAFVIGDGGIAACDGQVEVRGRAAGIEQRQTQAGHEIPASAAALEQAFELAAGATEAGRQHDARKECGPRGADMGRRGLESVLGGEHVGAVGEQIRRQTGRQCPREAIIGNGQRGRRQCDRRTEQQYQCVVVLLAQALQAGAFGARLGQQRFRLRGVDLRRRAQFVAAAGDALRVLATGDGASGERDAIVEFALEQIGVGHLRHQAQRHRAARRLGGEIGLQRRVLEVGQPPPEVQLPGSQVERDLILLRDRGLTGRRQIGRQARARTTGTNGDVGQCVGTLNAIQRTCFVDARGGDAQIAVVVQCASNELAQHRIDEELLPVQRARRARCGLVGIARRGRQGWPLMRWRQRTGRQPDASKDRRHAGGTAGAPRGVATGMRREHVHAARLEKGDMAG
ncbi:MAG: hypothetical protein IOMNBAOH_00501 [Rhodocyclaceae bacterium]|nr:hypothetical protein [Rhodocyclaceae bacterium]